MSEFKILITDGLNEKGQAILKASADAVDQTGISADELIATVGDFDALILGSQLSELGEPLLDLFSSVFVGKQIVFPHSFPGHPQRRQQDGRRRARAMHAVGTVKHEWTVGWICDLPEQRCVLIACFLYDQTVNLGVQFYRHL